MMTSRRRTVRGLGLAAALAVLGGLAAPVALAQPGAGKPVAPAAGKPGKPGMSGSAEDFNGDGYRDTAVSANESAVNGKEGAGKVAVVYGSAKGPKSARKQMIHQDSPGIVGTAESRDFYGKSLTSADLDADGYTDLIVGTYGEDVGQSRAGEGSLSVVWGGKQGLKGSAILLEGEKADDLLGLDVTAGDVDGDGDQDVITTSGQKDLKVLSGPFQRSGKAVGGTATHQYLHHISDLATGDVNKDGKADLVTVATEAVVWKGTAKGLAPGVPVTDPKGRGVYGETVDLGDVNKDGYADLVVGHPFASAGEHDYNGTVTFVPGAKKGPDASKARTVKRTTVGIPARYVNHPTFGKDVSVGDVDGDGYAEIAIGYPAESEKLGYAGGAVFILRGSAAGPKTTGVKRFTQDSPGVPGASGKWDSFGSAVRLTDADGDRKADLYVGAQDEDAHAGEVWFLKGAGSGITGKGSVSFGAPAFGDAPGSTKYLGSAFSD